MSKVATKKTRTRLSPEVRKSMILDHAAEVIATEGVAGVSMERISREAGISKALVYTYFPSMTELLQTLLKREYKHLRQLQSAAAESAETFEQLVRRVTNVYLCYIEERGMLLEKLGSEPSVADHGDPTAYSRDRAVDYLAQIVSDNFGIDLPLAKATIDISFGMPSAAGHYLIHHEMSRQTVEDITVTMMIGSIEAIQSKYETALKPLRKPESA